MQEPIRSDNEILRSDSILDGVEDVESHEDIPNAEGGGTCPCCGRFSRTVEKVRQATAYQEEELNWFTGCEDCRQINDEYWDEQWKEYWGGLL